LQKVHLYFRIEPPKDRFITGDRYLIPLIKKLIRRKKTSGVEKVFFNLCKGFDQLHIDYDINLLFEKIRPGEPVVILGSGKFALKGYRQLNPIVAGIALMTHPSEWPLLCKQYPVVKYLQHSKWANDVYIPYYGVEKCELWPAGIDTEKWAPAKQPGKKFDILVYNKIRWDKQQMGIELTLPILKKLGQLDLSYHELIYGQYNEDEYFTLLKQCSAMIFLCEHESQGLACCEALSMNVPIIAWDQGFCLDPERFKWNDSVIPATAVPFFDERCGVKFKNFEDFEKVFDGFWNRVKSGGFSPRDYILQNLTLKKSAQRMLEIIASVYK